MLNNKKAFVAVAIHPETIDNELSKQDERHGLANNHKH